MVDDLRRLQARIDKLHAQIDLTLRRADLDAALKKELAELLEDVRQAKSLIEDVKRSRNRERAISLLSHLVRELREHAEELWEWLVEHFS